MGNGFEATLIFALIVGILGFTSGEKAGREDLASGRIVCEQTPLKKSWECVPAMEGKDVQIRN